MSIRGEVFEDGLERVVVILCGYQGCRKVVGAIERMAGEQHFWIRQLGAGFRTRPVDFDGKPVGDRTNMPLTMDLGSTEPLKRRPSGLLTFACRQDRIRTIGYHVVRREATSAALHRKVVTLKCDGGDKG